jgi:hypothetical protein
MPYVPYGTNCASGQVFHTLEPMPTVQIPRSAISRGVPTYTQLIRRIYPQRAFAAFKGRYFKCGKQIDTAELWPDSGYPAVPLLLEYAGNDKTGWGHRRSNDIYLLWRYDMARNEFVEVARFSGDGRDAISHMKFVAFREIRRGCVPDPALARKVAERVLTLLDDEVDCLEADERAIALSFVFEQLAARAA